MIMAPVRGMILFNLNTVIFIKHERQTGNYLLLIIDRTVALNSYGQLLLTKDNRFHPLGKQIHPKSSFNHLHSNSNSHTWTNKLLSPFFHGQSNLSYLTSSQTHLETICIPKQDFFRLEYHYPLTILPQMIDYMSPGCNIPLIAYHGSLAELDVWVWV